MWLGGLWKPRQAGEGLEPLQGPRRVRLQPRGSTTHLHRGGLGASALPLLRADGTCWDGSPRGHQDWLRACRSRPSVCPLARMEMLILGTLPETCLFGRFRS